MLEVGLEFEGAVDRVVEAFLILPTPLRPIYFSHQEASASDADRIADSMRFAAFLAKAKSGFFLLGEGQTYSLRIAHGRPVLCDCFLEASADLAKQFVVHMAQAKPSFGFACKPGERERRNRVAIEVGANKIEGWVGRDTQTCLPGFYWLTLVSEALAQRHAVPIEAVASAARKHAALGNGVHLFCFYEQPDDWLADRTVDRLVARFPGVFDIEKVKPQLIGATTVGDVLSMLGRW
jgi:hypothetical protein